MWKLDLMTTEGCHLCDDAIAILQGNLQPDEVEVDLVDIVYDEDLLARYAEQIPVLVNRDTGEELAWPFDGQALRQFLVSAPTG